MVKIVFKTIDVPLRARAHSHVGADLYQFEATEVSQMAWRPGANVITNKGEAFNEKYG